MESVRVKIRGIVVTNQYGTLQSGDIIDTDPAYARHLVDDLKAAEYADARPADAPAPDEASREDDYEDAEAKDNPEAAAARRPRRAKKDANE